MTSNPPVDWKSVRDYEDIRFEVAEGLAKITICRPEVRNAFRPRTLFELIDAFSRAREETTRSQRTSGSVGGSNASPRERSRSRSRQGGER